MKRKPAVVLVYLLGIYVLFQFSWWGFHIIDLTKAVKKAEPELGKRILMIVGEGVVFITLLIVGLLYIVRSIKKDIKMAIQQNNFMLSVTHELKTPVAANKLYLQTLLKHQLTDEKRNELIGKSLNENNRLEALVDQILTASQLEQGALHTNKTPLNVESELAQLISIQEERQEGKFTLRSSYNGTILTDPFMFRTVLSNLFENAVKYGMTEKGVLIQLSKQEQKVAISVQDYGKGIDISDQQLLFKKFTRLGNEETRSTKGTGLGLYIAFEMSKKLGGQLSYKAQREGGACFQLLLPYE